MMAWVGRNTSIWSRPSLIPWLPHRATARAPLLLRSITSQQKQASLWSRPPRRRLSQEPRGSLGRVVSRESLGSKSGKKSPCSLKSPRSRSTQSKLATLCSIEHSAMVGFFASAAIIQLSISMRARRSQVGSSCSLRPSIKVY